MIDGLLADLVEMVPSGADAAYLSDTLIDLAEMAGRVIDESTPIGQYVRTLERSVAELEAALEAGSAADIWRRRYALAVQERNRAEARVAELEGRLDVVTGRNSRPSSARKTDSSPAAAPKLPRHVFNL